MRSGNKWPRHLATAFCLLIAVGNVAALVVAPFTDRWETVPTSLVFAVVFGFVAYGRLRPARSTHANGADPGWVPSLRAFAPFPFLFSFRNTVGGLAGLRAVFTSFVIAIVLFASVMASLSGLPNGPVVPWVPLLAAFAAMAVLGETATGRRPLLCDSPARLAGSYRARFFLRVAFAESIALLGFTMSFTGGPAWIYYPAAAFTLLLFATYVAPTRAALARDQTELDARGCGLSLVAALTTGETT